MGSHRSQLTTRLAAFAAGRPFLRRIAHTVARRAARRHYVAAIAVVLADDRVLLARHRFRENAWSLPGGWVRRLEDPARACEREVREELGMAVEAVAPVAVEPHAVEGKPVAYGGLSIAYRCVPIDRAQPLPAASVEITEARWIDVVAASDFVDGFQLDALDAALRHRARADRR